MLTHCREKAVDLVKVEKGKLLAVLHGYEKDAKPELKTNVDLNATHEWKQVCHRDQQTES